MVKLAQKLQKGDPNLVIVDVRTPGEFNDTSQSKSLNIGRLKGAINLNIMDLQKNPDMIHQLDQYKDKEIYVVCSHSYRSRRVSNMLLNGGFQNVTNVQGGMTEWYRDYDELKSYQSVRELHGSYKNISPSEIYAALKNEKPLIIQIAMQKPWMGMDSTWNKFYSAYPVFKSGKSFSISDTAQILEYAKSAPGKKVVVWSHGSQGGSIASWLANKGVDNVYNLIGRTDALYDYLLNYHPETNTSQFFTAQNKINFVTPLSLCKTMQKQNYVFIDLRPDTSFSKTTNGTKLEYKYLKGAVNFPYSKTADDFIKAFPDKNKNYVFLTPDLISGLDLANELANAGYKINWLSGGNERWEWYTNNIVNFHCGDYLVK